MARAGRLTMEGGITGRASRFDAGGARQLLPTWPQHHESPQKAAACRQYFADREQRAAMAMSAAQYLLEAGYEAVCFAAAPAASGNRRHACLHIL